MLTFNHCIYSGTNAYRWEKQLGRLAGKMNFLVVVAWGNKNIPTGNARGSYKGRMKPWKRATALL